MAKRKEIKFQRRHDGLRGRQNGAEDNAKERARKFRDKLEEAGISYTTYLNLSTEYAMIMNGPAHNILLGWERGEGWPSGT